MPRECEIHQNSDAIIREDKRGDAVVLNKYGVSMERIRKRDERKGESADLSIIVHC
jgi:16S rRNA C1402 (ribose-2'-O) methylase RsmI